MFFKNIDELKRIGKNYNSIYLYGAGLYGKVYKQILEDNLVDVAGFLVSNKDDDEYCGLKVFEAKQKIDELGDDCCIVLSLSKKFHREIFRDFTFNCDVYCLEDGYENVFVCMPFFGLMAKVGKCHKPINKIKLSDGGNILVVQIEVTFGDVIWTTAFIREMRLNYPNSTITFVINKKMSHLIENCPYIDEIAPYPLARKITYISPNDLYEDCKLFCEKLDKCFDAVFLPRLLPNSAIGLWENVLISQCVHSKYLFAHALTHTPELENAVMYFEPYFSKIVKHYFGEHEVKRDLSLLLACGGVVKNENMELWIDSDSEKYAYEILNSAKKTIYIAVGLVASATFRSWPASKYNKLFKKIKELKRNVKLILCGGENAKEAAALALLGNEDICIDITVKTNLQQAAAVIKQCDFYLGSDTGLMHMAAAFGKPIIEITPSLPESPPTFGLSPTRTGPWCVPNIVYRPPYALGRCKFVCLEKKAHCIKLIKVEEVFNGVVKFINLYGRKQD